MNDNQPPKRLARIAVDYKIMHQLLRLPENVTIARVVEPSESSEYYGSRGYCELVIESEDHDGLPGVLPGEKIPVIIPRIHQKTVFDYMDFES